ncbi:MAG TPA: hypothetical protein VLH56_11250 [Dissulfurispiraceae bacterium]|nr:hypothetical protein [Dissulfurispiraceae bacterium]
MIKKYVKIIRPEYGEGGYIEAIENVSNALDGEFDGAEAGDRIILELVEMEESEFKNMPEFTGW